VSNLQIDGDRLWQSLMDMAAIGATPAGGCNRQALTAEDGVGRELFRTWCEAAGCSVRVDAIGNMFARRAGANPTAPAILVGSHLDTQPTGGKFDGVFGVLAGLEVIRTLNDHNVATESPIDLAVWTNEEGARFAPAMQGSGVWAGVFEIDDAYAATDKTGVTLETALRDLDQLGTEPAAPFPIKSAYEIHIEQGPILEAKNKQIGVVTGVQGIRWYDLTIQGAACHAGPTPMNARRDPVRVLGQLLEVIYALIDRHGPRARVTFGELRAEPGSRNTVPERVTVSVDLRHPDQTVFDQIDRDLRELVGAATLPATLDEFWHSPAVTFDATCIETVRAAVSARGYPALEMVSGAGHDSVYVARVAPTAMIFVPCKDGLSHNEAESATADDLSAGANVLLETVLLTDAR
jgi:N-carbamoyl-L-amino-acid hydrolase